MPPNPNMPLPPLINPALMTNPSVHHSKGLPFNPTLTNPNPGLHNPLLTNPNPVMTNPSVYHNKGTLPFNPTLTNPNPNLIKHSPISTSPPMNPLLTNPKLVGQPSPGILPNPPNSNPNPTPMNPLMTNPNPFPGLIRRAPSLSGTATNPTPRGNMPFGMVSSIPGSNPASPRGPAMSSPRPISPGPKLGISMQPPTGGGQFGLAVSTASSPESPTSPKPINGTSSGRLGIKPDFASVGNPHSDDFKQRIAATKLPTPTPLPPTNDNQDEKSMMDFS